LPHDERAPTAGLPDGYYFMGGCGDPQWCLVYLYDHPDFGGVRHIAYGAQDGGGLVPVWGIREDAELVPAVAVSADRAMTLADLRPNVGAKRGGTACRDDSA
jgi:hypothetical protein